jgi:YggT family protein
MYIEAMGPTAIVYTILFYVLQTYTYIVFAAVVASWLINFNVVNYHNNFVRMVVRFLEAVTEPVFAVVRKVLPPVGGLDFSPLVVLAAVWVLTNYVLPYLALSLYRVIG